MSDAVAEPKRDSLKTVFENEKNLIFRTACFPRPPPPRLENNMIKLDLLLPGSGFRSLQKELHHVALAVVGGRFVGKDEQFHGE